MKIKTNVRAGQGANSNSALDTPGAVPTRHRCSGNSNGNNSITPPVM
jgi:hypothetical protein